MPLDLDSPIAWTTADAEGLAMLADLQGNILKGHGRHATLNLFLRLGEDVATSRLLMRRLGALTISALDQLRGAETHKAARKAGLPTGATPPFFTVMLTSAGYAKLGRTAMAPADAAFQDGMRARAGVLADSENEVDAAWRGERADVLVMIADDPDAEEAWTSQRIDAAEVEILNLVTALGATVLHKQAGRAIFRTQPNGKTEGIEHFGYVDGRSQPLFLSESIAEEGKSRWDPEFPLRQVLVADPGAAGSFGSFFVFRKLGQDVAGFKAAEARLEGLRNHDAKLLGDAAGPMIVGRFEDGGAITDVGTTLLTRIAAGTARIDDPVPNDFDYRDDMEGLRCPFHAHVRKTNPRGDTVRLGFATDDSNERSRLMARRGITFGERDRVIDPDDEDPSLPQRDIGLLFMSYQSDLAHQFEFTQQSWANGPAFAAGLGGKRPPGRDPVIGQRGGDEEALLEIRHAWNDPTASTSEGDFGEHVTFRGGEYFFAPARSMLLSM